MKRIQYNQYGGPDNMRLENFELPQPTGEQVTVKVKFSSINPIDWKLRNGIMKMMTGKNFPRAMGMDFSGTVISVGSGVTRFAPGDHVFGMASMKQPGAFGEAVMTDQSSLTIKPAAVTFEQAACLATPGVTAWMGLVEKAKIKPGQHVFVNGCAGAVGEAAVQIALMLGAQVSGSCSANDIERMQKVGLKRVYDYRKTDLVSIGARYDIVYDTAATLPASLGLKLLKKNGVFLELNPDPLKFLRSFVSRKFKIVLCKATPENLGHVAGAAEHGNLKLPIGKTVSLSCAINLIKEIEGGTKIGGKGVIAME